MKTLTMKILTIIILMTSIVSCGSTSSSVTTVGNPAASLDIVVSNDIETESTSNLGKYVTIDSGAYTPDMYILGIRNMSLIQCMDSVGTDVNCPGDTGEEVEDNLANGETMTTVLLNETVTDYIIYQSTNSPVSTALGDDSAFVTEEITAAALYSGVQFGLDFIVTQFPLDDTTLSLGIAGPGEVFAMYCMNHDGCSDLTGYDSSYDGLGDGDVQSGDIGFLDATDSTWYYWDTDAEDFSAITDTRPTNVLEQGSVAGHPTGTNDEILYSASFGTLDGIDITQALIDAGATDELTVVYSVEDTMSFTDDNADDVIDADEMETFTFGKFHIEDFSLADDTFAP